MSEIPPTVVFNASATPLNRSDSFFGLINPCRTSCGDRINPYTAEGTAVSIGGNTNQQRDMAARERGSFGWGKVEEIIEILVPSTIPKNNSLYLAGSLRKRKLHLIRVRRFRSVNCCYSVNGSFGKHSRRWFFFGWLMPAFDHASKIVEVPPT